MAKRFIDTETLLRPSIRVCSTPYKLFWIALITRCDHAGIWVKDFEMINLLCGTNIDEKNALKHFSDNIVEIDNGKRWFIPDFIDFQYPSGLKSGNNAHISAIKILSKYELWDGDKLRVSPDPKCTLHSGSQDKEMDKETVKDMVKEEKEVSSKKNNPELSFEKFWNLYDKKVGDKEKVKPKWNALNDENKKFIMAYIPNYKNSQPDKIYRKNPMTFLNQKGWKDELLIRPNTKQETNNHPREFNRPPAP